MKHVRPAAILLALLAIVVVVAVSVASVMVLDMPSAPGAAIATGVAGTDVAERPRRVRVHVVVERDADRAPTRREGDVVDPGAAYEAALRLGWWRDGGSTEVEVWVERVIEGRGVPDDAPLPPDVGERYVLPVERGFVRVPVDSRTTRVVVVDGAQRAVWEPGVGPAGTPIVLAAPPPGAVRVRVRDASGRVVLGAPVAILRRDATSLTTWGGEVVTGLPDGLAYLAVVPERRGPAGEFLVALRLQTARPVVAPLPADRSQVIELVAPPTGRLFVDVDDEGGRPFGADARASVRVAGPHNPASEAPVFTSERVEKGRAIFGLVPAGVDLEIVVRASGRWPAIARGVRTAAGTRTEVTLRVGDLRPRVVGRAVGTFASTPQVSVSSALADVHGSAASDPETGEFEVTLGGNASPGPDTVLDVVIGALGPTGRRLVARRSRRLAEVPDDGVLDLGDVRLDPEPELLTGTVRDERGMPVRGVYLRVEWRDETGEWRRSSRAAESGRDGAFVVHGEAPPGELRITAEGDRQLVAGPQPFEAERRGLELAVLPWEMDGYVSGSLRLPGGVTGALGWMETRRDGDAEWERHSVHFAPSGHVRLVPGTWSVRLGVRGDDEPLAVAQAVRVGAGETVAPRELATVDPGIQVSVVRLRVLRPGGAAEPLAKVWWRLADAPRNGDGASWWQEARPGADGVVALPVRADEAVEAAATAPGLGWGQIDAARSHAELVLPPARSWPIPVHVGESLRQAAGRATVSVSLVRLSRVPGSEHRVADIADPRARPRGTPVTPGADVELTATAVGTYGVLVSLRRGRSDGSGGRGVGLGEPFGEVRVDGDSPLPEIRVEPTPEQVADALRRLDDALRGE